MATFDGQHPQPPGRLEIDADLAHLRGVRQFVRERLPSVPERLADDVVLVASELVTNGIEHGDGGHVIVEIGDDDDAVVLRVTTSGPSPNVVAPGDWDVTPTDSVCGRGLGIIRAATDDVVVHQTGSALVTTARFLR